MAPLAPRERLFAQALDICPPIPYAELVSAVEDGECWAGRAAIEGKNIVVTDDINGHCILTPRDLGEGLAVWAAQTIQHRDTETPPAFALAALDVRAERWAGLYDLDLEVAEAILHVAVEEKNSQPDSYQSHLPR